jgi:hypothetical protein
MTQIGKITTIVDCGSYTDDLENGQEVTMIAKMKVTPRMFMKTKGKKIVLADVPECL